VEKAFTVNAKQARELVELAREKKVFLAEAFWTRYMPSRKMIVDLIDSGIIGEVTSVMSNFGASLENRERLVKPELAGGALLDLGVYPINFALMYVKGEVKNVSAVSIQTEAGVDMTNSVTLTFENNVIALLHSDMRAQMMGGGVIYGREGYIAVKGAINPEEILVFNRDRQVVKNVEIPKQITGYEYEVKACMEALKAGKLECEEMPHSETLKLMELLDEIRGQWGMKYPCEE
jgi:predicted dehydrogenase